MCIFYYYLHICHLLNIPSFICMILTTERNMDGLVASKPQLIRPSIKPYQRH